MKRLLLIFIFLLIQPVSTEQIKYNTYRPLYQEVQYPQSINRPRKVKGYTADGDSIDTGSGRRLNPDDMWNPNYYYYYNGEYWYRSNNGVWLKWSSILDFDLLGWDWYNRNPLGNLTLYYQNKPVPVGTTSCLLLFSVLYILKKKYGRLDKKLQNCKRSGTSRASCCKI